MSRIRTKTADAIGSMVADLADEMWAHHEDKTESPIETALLVAFDLKLLVNSERYLVADPEREYLPLKERGIAIWTQRKFEGYRVDFLIEFALNDRGLSEKIIIEADGHDFHEKTKEQAQRDKSRDRILQASVGKVFRFTGSEIYRDVCACVEEIYGYIDTRRYEQWRKDTGLDQ